MSYSSRYLIMYNKHPKFCLLLVCAAIAVAFAACGTNNAVTPSSSTTKIVVVNTSPDVGPLALFLNNIQLGGTANTIASRTWFRYSTTPTYYSIGTADSLLFQLQSYPYKVISKLSAYHQTKGNTSYSMFIVGIASIDSLAAIFTIDTAAIPKLGLGKIRFINASPRTPALDVSINGSAGFTKIAYAKVSNYVTVPAGTYEFKLTANGSPNSVLNTLSRITVLDGKLYTLYTKGLVGRTDSAAISMNIITQK
jgi:hypothetical protein